MVLSTPMRHLVLEGLESAQREPGVVTAAAAAAHPKIELHPFNTQDGLLVKIQPPQCPGSPDLEHVPCDIVLVIDISSSMGEDAPVPGDTTERTGLTILDLTKHAAKTTLATLNEKDRLGIVTFDTTAKVCQPLLPMTIANKETTQHIIERIVPGAVTNIWSGLTLGLSLFEDNDVKNSTNIPALMLLTDGLPNHMHPQPGYIPKLRTMQPFRPSIHTFGFGYRLRSGLLKSIADMSGGNYSFIPDAGMIGTVFVHAIANLQSTFATESVLHLTYPKNLCLEETTGAAVHTEAPKPYDEERLQLTIRLGNLQYGQSRDIYLRGTPCSGMPLMSEPVVHALLEYRRSGEAIRRPGVQRSMFDPAHLEPEEIAYHISRSAIIASLSSINPIDALGEHRPPRELDGEMMATLAALHKTIPAQQHPDDPRNKSLLMDLAGNGPYGQIGKALSSDEHYSRWGYHYLPSLAGAHARQICNSFRDPGPLMYGAASPLFIRCRDALDLAFESLPPPEPTKRPTSKYTANLSMRTYHSRDASQTCFAACSMVELAKEAHGDSLGDCKMIPISRLRAGMSVRTPRGPRRVAAVLRTPVRQARMCLVGDLLVTAWHPISLDGKVWTFPTYIAQRSVRYTGSIYSVLLQRDSDIEAAALMVSGVWGVTLGHGLLVDPAAAPDPRAHTFFGDYGLVVKALAGLHRTRNGLFLARGTHRDPRTGLVDGFERAPLPVGPLARPVAQCKKRIAT